MGPNCLSHAKESGTQWFAIVLKAVEEVKKLMEVCAVMAAEGRTVGKRGCMDVSSEELWS